MITHLLDNRLTDGGEVVSLTCRPPFTPRKSPVRHLSYSLNGLQGHGEAGRIGSIENLITSSGMKSTTVVCNLII
jgi:hypothetical protein